jgi:hypothetical protein
MLCVRTYVLPQDLRQGVANHHITGLKILFMYLISVSYVLGTYVVAGRPGLW